MKELLVLLFINFESIDAQRTCDHIQSDHVVQKIPYKDDNGGDHCFFELGQQILETIALDTVGNFVTKLQTECNKIKEGSALPAPSNKEMLQYFIELFLRLHKSQFVALGVQIIGTDKEANNLKIRVQWNNDVASEDFIDPRNVMGAAVPGNLVWKNVSTSAMTFLQRDKSIMLISFNKDDRLISNQLYLAYCHYTVFRRVKRAFSWPECAEPEIAFSRSYNYSAYGTKHCFLVATENVKNQTLRPNGKSQALKDFFLLARNTCRDEYDGSFLPSPYDYKLMTEFIEFLEGIGMYSYQDLNVYLGATIKSANGRKNVQIAWDNGANSTINNGENNVFGVSVRNKALVMEQNVGTHQFLRLNLKTPTIAASDPDSSPSDASVLVCHYIVPAGVTVPVAPTVAPTDPTTHFDTTEDDDDDNKGNKKFSCSIQIVIGVFIAIIAKM